MIARLQLVRAQKAEQRAEDIQHALNLVLNLGFERFHLAPTFDGAVDEFLLGVVRNVPESDQRGCLNPRKRARTRTKDDPLSDQSIFVCAAVQGVIREAIIAAALTAAMILIFLGTLIIAVSIPLSIHSSIIVLSLPASAVKNSVASVVACEILDQIPMSEIGIAINKRFRAAVVDNFRSFALRNLGHSRNAWYANRS